ncbi:MULTISPECIES: hypothetical protein [Paraburkholderia]|uniref:hypothetical protein n=1 Tax=Paraburkholderia TaxID=1822464 RepID=UPI0016560312|nr:hypothetical protein [Paraburkholderia podalyriae]
MGIDHPYQATVVMQGTKRDVEQEDDGMFVTHHAFDVAPSRCSARTRIGNQGR